jgi:hypothetical protein
MSDRDRLALVLRVVLVLEVVALFAQAVLPLAGFTGLLDFARQIRGRIR